MIRSFPVPAEARSRAFYSVVRERTIQLISAVPGVRSIYQFGSIGAPGNSDIDLMIVVEADRKVAGAVLSLMENQLTDAEKFIIFQHDPLITSASVAPRINLLRGRTALNHLWGERYQFEQPTDVSTRLFILVELLTQYYPRVFMTAGRDARLRMQHINAFRFPLRLLSDLCVNNDGVVASPMLDDIERVLERNNELRSDPWGSESAKIEREIGSNERSMVLASREMIRLVDRYIKGTMTGAVQLVPGRVKDRRFLANNAADVSEARFLGRHVTFWNYPASFRQFFIGRCAPEYRQGIQTRKVLLDSYCHFIDRVACGRGLYYPWWKRKDGIITRVRRAVADAHLRQDAL